MNAFDELVKVIEREFKVASQLPAGFSRQSLDIIYSTAERLMMERNQSMCLKNQP
jgi:hypothetical protein